MEKYTFLPHTADMKFKAYGKNLEEAFSNSALALADTLVDVNKVKLTKNKKIIIQAHDKKSLLYDFLEQFLYLVDAENFVAGKIKSLKIEQGKKLKLTAVISGNTWLEKHGFKRHVKAVTYNDMIIEEKPKKVTIQVVLDL